MQSGRSPLKQMMAILVASGMVLLNLPHMVLAQAGSGETREQIAVWDFSLEGMQRGDGRAVTNRLRSELVNSGKFQVMSRDQIKTLLGEQALGQTLVDAKEAIKAGKLKGVKFVVTGTIVSVRGAFQITAEMIDGESAEIIKSITPGTYRGKFLDFLDNEIPRLSAQLIGERPSSSVVSKPPAQPEPALVAERPPEPEQKADQPAASGGMGGMGVAGVVSLAAAGVFQIIALASASTADTDSDAATTDDEYQQALDDRESAEGIQGLAAVLGIVGAVLLLIDPGPDNSTADGGYGLGAPPVGFNVDVQPRSVMAGYALRW